MKIATIAFLTVSLAAAAGCKKDEKQAPKETPSVGKTTTGTTPGPVEPKWSSADSLMLWTECGAAFNAHDAAKLAACYSPDARFTMIDWQGPAMEHSGEAIMKSMDEYWKAFPDVKGTSQLVLVNGNRVAAISHDEATNSGSMGGIPATNKKVSVYSAVLSEFGADGKIKSDRILGDQATWSHQMGLYKSPTAPSRESGWDTVTTAAATDADAGKIDANVAIVTNIERAIAAGDTETIKAHVTDDVAFRYVPEAKVAIGADDYVKGFTAWLGLFENLNREVKDAWGAGDWVVTVVEHKGKLAIDIENPKKVSTKGKMIATTQVAFFRIVDAKISHHWVFENSYSFAAQAGLADLPAQ